MTNRVESLTISHGGKGEAVRKRLPSGEIQNICECWHNIDGSRGCISQVPVELLLEAVENNGSYAPGNFASYRRKGLIDHQKCEYCYGRGINNGNVRPREVNIKTRKSFEKYKPAFVRCGKFVDMGHPYYYPSLDGLFRLCEEFHTGLIFTTKLLPYGIEGAEQATDYARGRNDAVAAIARQVAMPSGQELADRLRKIKENLRGTTLSYSLGWDKMEKGACSQGFTNEWRIEQAKRYLGQGVNVVLTVVADLGHSIEENVKRGNSIQKALDARKDGLVVRLLPLRPNKREVCEFIAGCGFEGLIFNPNDCIIPGMEAVNGFPVVDGIEQKPYQRAESAQELIIRAPHSDFQNLIDEGIGVCGKIGDYEYCDKCNLWQERIKFPVSELADREKVYNKRPKKKKDKNQPILF